jgi:hypothetical protein
MQLKLRSLRLYGGDDGSKLIFCGHFGRAPELLKNLIERGFSIVNSFAPGAQAAKLSIFPALVLISGATPLGSQTTTKQARASRFKLDFYLHVQSSQSHHNFHFVSRSICEKLQFPIPKRFIQTM